MFVVRSVMLFVLEHDVFELVVYSERQEEEVLVVYVCFCIGC
jgi:hypothetical protein